ncbi:hypothetical protein M758_8G027300 [Ceratodon purpureus]|nr:hypothetical protein M758_8G027300 [Ceratodon purpureus]
MCTEKGNFLPLRLVRSINQFGIVWNASTVRFYRNKALALASSLQFLNRSSKINCLERSLQHEHDSEITSTCLFLSPPTPPPVLSPSRPSPPCLEPRIATAQRIVKSSFFQHEQRSNANPLLSLHQNSHPAPNQAQTP